MFCKRCCGLSVVQTKILVLVSEDSELNVYVCLLVPAANGYVALALCRLGHVRAAGRQQLVSVDARQ